MAHQEQSSSIPQEDVGQYITMEIDHTALAFARPILWDFNRDGCNAGSTEDPQKCLALLLHNPFLGPRDNDGRRLFGWARE
jgi:hypothetical protein